MANDGAASIFGVALRVTRLDAAGAPLVGANSMYVTDAMTQVTFAGEFSAGDDIELKNAGGGLCVAYKAPDTLKRLTVGVTLCTPDPELTEMLAGGVVLTDATETVGYAYPEVGEDPTPNGVSLEVWTRAILGGDSAPVNPYYRWLLPRVRLRIDQRNVENQAMVTPLTGQGTQNPGWGTGPADDWTYTSNRVLQMVRTASHPAPALGYQEVVAPV